MAKLEYIEIKAFTTAERDGNAEIFNFVIHPGSVKSEFQNEFKRAKGINTSGRKASYAYSRSKEMAFKLMIDQTLSSEHLRLNYSESENSVKEIVDLYMKHCFYMDGDIHEPKFLLLHWDSSFFECRLKSVNITHSAINDKGQALRAILDCVFVEDMATAKRIRLENKKSPDITHSRIVLEGETLPGLAKKVYGDSAHYIMLAEFNELNHFRQLEAGMRLYFPPLTK